MLDTDPSCPSCQVKLHEIIFRMLKPQSVSLMVDLVTVGCFFLPCSSGLVSQVCVSKLLWPLVSVVGGETLPFY